MNKTIILLFFVLVIFGLTGCSNEDPSITIYTRDTTSGTRDGFFSTINFDDAIKDNTVLASKYVEVAGNGDMISALKNDEYGIGYISLSSLPNSTLNGLNFNNVEPSEENVINGSYALTRNFNYAIRENFDTTKEEQIVEAFVGYMNTVEGKATIQGSDGIVEILNSDPSWNDIKNNYPVIDEDNSNITIKFGGSTSVEKVAKALSAEFSVKCGNFVAEHSHTGSGDAYKRVQGSEKDGANKIHIGFASREFKLSDTEPLAADTYGKVCTDAIVVVVNSSNDLTNITKELLVKIYDGTISTWKELE